jgi:hypothetical protein
MSYLDDQIKIFDKAVEAFMKKSDEVIDLLNQKKVLSDLDKHMAIYEAELISKEI